MKKILMITGYILCAVLVVLYLTFLFILPHKIDLNVYKTDIQKLVKENTGLDFDCGKIKFIVSPFLEAGIKTDNIKVTLPDKSVLFSADKVKSKIFLPSLLWLSVRVSQAEIDNPRINLDIENSEKFKAAKVYEDIVNKRRQDKLAHPEKYLKNEEVVLPFDITKIKVNIPKIKIENYRAVVDDVKAAHKLTLKGDELILGYYNGRTAKLKTDAKFLSDNSTNITANLNIDTALPKFIMPPKEEEDNEAVFEIPFVNPVQIYRDYDLKSKISSKLKIRKDRKKDFLKINGYFNIDDTTLSMSGLQLPKSYFHLKGKGYRTLADLDLFVTDKEHLKITSDICHGKKRSIDLTMNSNKIYLNNLLNIVKAYLDTAHIKNDIKDMSAGGYLYSNAAIKTDFQKLKSQGKILVRNGNIVNNNLGVLFNDIRLNLFFDNDSLNIKNTHLLINNKPLDISGEINSDSVANFTIKGDNIPLTPLYKSFAPREVKNNYDLVSGLLTIDSKITGEIKNIAALIKCDIAKLVFKDKANSFILSNDLTHFALASYEDKIRGRLKNTGLKFFLPQINSAIKNDSMIVDIDNDKILLNKSVLQFNKNSLIAFEGSIKNYLTNYMADFKAGGQLQTSDIATALGKDITPYFDIKGKLPVKAGFTAKGNNLKLIAQAQADKNNFITPLHFKDLKNNVTIFNLLVNKKNDTVKIEKTGIFVKNQNAEFGDKLGKNLWGAKELIAVKGIFSNVSFQPFISLFKISFAHDMEGSVAILKRSKFLLNGHLQAFGKPQNPNIKGEILIKNLNIPEIYTKIDKISTNVTSRNIKFILDNINANGSLFRISADTNMKLVSELKLYNVHVLSRFIDINKLLKTSEALTKALPAPAQSSNSANTAADIPVSILNGRIHFKKIVMDKIIVDNTTAAIKLLKNILYINKLKTTPLGGNVNGDVTVDLKNLIVNTNLAGKNFDIKKVLLDAMDMQDMLTGKMNFIADLTFSGIELEQQLKSLQGGIDFNIKNGQLGPFGKFENFLMAENIRENKFFSSSIGSIITNFLSFDTSRYNELYGHLTFSDGVAQISPIKSQGDVMSMFIFGDVNLLDNSAELKIRGKLASAFSDKLGPLANLNPINLIKNTPGLNIVLVKAFTIFCESVSEEEMKAIPHLAEGKSDENATKFQIRLKGDTRKPLKMIKSFKWLALNSEIESAKEFVDTLPVPEAGEEDLSVEELIKLREEQAAAKAAQEAEIQAAEEQKPVNKIKKFLKIRK